MASGEVNTGVKYKDFPITSFNLAANTGTYKAVNTSLKDRIISITCFCDKWQINVVPHGIYDSSVEIYYYNRTSSAVNSIGSSVRIAYI